MPESLHIDAFFDPATATFSYLLMDPQTRAAAVIDSVLDFDPKSGRTRTESAERIRMRAAELQADVHWHLETHVHADHLSAAPYLQQALGGKIAIGERVLAVQETFGRVFNLGPEFARDGRQFDRLLRDGERLPLGRLSIEVIATPGHTPACLSYCLEADGLRHVFVGDTLFMPDYGTARCDFPGGDAATLYRSIQRLLALPPETRLYLCHDYPPDGRAPQHLTTVQAERDGNIHVRAGVSEAEFSA
ncbi:MAG: MBL fold metallo-hydrolase, partial [Arenimonas sp.]